MGNRVCLSRGSRRVSITTIQKGFSKMKAIWFFVSSILLVVLLPEGETAPKLTPLKWLKRNVRKLDELSHRTNKKIVAIDAHDHKVKRRAAHKIDYPDSDS